MSKPRAETSSTGFQTTVEKYSSIQLSGAKGYPGGRWARFLDPELYQPDLSLSFEVASAIAELVESRDAWSSF